MDDVGDAILMKKFGCGGAVLARADFGVPFILSPAWEGLPVTSGDRGTSLSSHPLTCYGGCHVHTTAYYRE